MKNKTQLVVKQVSILVILVFVFACKNSPSGTRGNEQTKELGEVADSISVLMKSYHYNPAELNSAEYGKLDKAVQELVLTAKTKDEFISNYNLLWQDGPFSHVRLAMMEQPAEKIAQYIDSLRVGEHGLSLEWIGNTALLTVTTMNGVDTKELVFDAYKELSKNSTDTLIIDLRNNTGGTFAGIPLIAHLIKEPRDIGMFVSQKWWTKNAEAPTIEDVQGLAPWKGWSIQAFWHDVQENALTRVKVEPMLPHFNGPVYVLISKKTASAAEFTVDAMAGQENITIIGETTAGEMLSQKMFDLPKGLQLSLPIADYYSTRIGRIEGKGVAPDIEINQSVAMDLAMALIKGAKLEEALAQLEEKLSKMKVQPFEGETLYLFGNMNDWGKKLDITPKFEYKGDGVFTTRAEFKKGSYEFKIAPMGWDFDFGAIPNQEKVIVGQKTTLAKVPGSGNLLLEIKAGSKLTFSLDVSNMDKAILEVSE